MSRRRTFQPLTAYLSAFGHNRTEKPLFYEGRALAIPVIVAYSVTMKRITLNNGDKVKVDDEDYLTFSNRTWHCHKLSNGRKYAVSRYYNRGKRMIEYLHRAIVGDDAVRVSFANNDTYDCRKQNLVTTQTKAKPADAGATGEAAIIYDLTKRGHAVYVPLAGHCAADLVSCKGASPAIRWQIKLRSAREGASVALALHSIHPRAGGYDKSPIDRERIDAFAIFNPVTEQVFYLSTDDIPIGAKSISINTSANPSANAKYLASDYRDPNRILSQRESQ